MGKALSSFLRVEPFTSLLVSRHCTCHHLTQPAGLASLRGTDSRSFYDNAVGTAEEGWFYTQRSCTTLPVYVLLIYMAQALSAFHAIHSFPESSAKPEALYSLTGTQLAAYSEDCFFLSITNLFVIVM